MTEQLKCIYVLEFNRSKFVFGVVYILCGYKLLVFLPLL